MRIAIDASDIKADGAGISKYLRGIVYGASKISDHEFLIIVRSKADFEEVRRDDATLSQMAVTSNIEVVERPPKSKLVGGGIAWYWSLAKFLKQQRVDGLISSNLNVAGLFFPNVIQILYDFSALNSVFFSRWDTIRTRVFLWLSISRAWRILCISQTTKDELVKRYPSKESIAKVIPAGISQWALKKPTAEDITYARSQLSLPDKYILSVSTLQPRKNYVRMLQAFAQMASDYAEHHYVVVGQKGWYYEEIFNEVKQLGIEGRVHFLGYVDDDYMPAVFAQAAGLAYVSLEEGFGLPLIEASAIGLPIVASDISVFREMKLPESVELVDPEDTKAITQAMEKIFSRPKTLPDKEFFEYYSWENAMQTAITGIIPSDEKA